MVGWREKKEQVWQNSHQFITRTLSLRNFFAKSISHQICYYVWSQTIRKAKHIDIINMNLLKKYFTTMCLLNQNTEFYKLVLPHLRGHQTLHTLFGQLLRKMVRNLEGKSILHTVHVQAVFWDVGIM